MIDRLSNSLKNKGRAAHNNTYKKLAVQCSEDTFVGNQSLVLRINICGQNRQLLVAAKRVCLESTPLIGEECCTKDGSLSNPKLTNRVEVKRIDWLSKPKKRKNWTSANDCQE